MKNVRKKMSWIPEDHKKLYSQAFSALYEDAKTTTSSLVTNSKTLIVNGYQSVKKYLNQDSSDDDDNGSNCTDQDFNQDDCNNTNERTDNNLVEMGDFYPDVLISLHKTKKYVNKIWVIDDSGHKKPVTGMISSYQYINDIIHKWFRYEEIENVGSGNACYRWLPTENLYTKYRESSRVLSPIDNILFRYERVDYVPQRYHPLI